MQPAACRHDTADESAGKPGGKLVPLRVRALKLLTRRDYSPAELARRLAPHTADPGELSALLEELQRLGSLSEQRFAEQLVRKAATRYGTRRVIEQLQERGIDNELAARFQSELTASELQRARAIWAKRFGHEPADLREHGRQARFLERRGFDAEVIRRVLRSAPEE